MYRIASRTQTTRTDRSEKINLEHFKTELNDTKQYIENTKETINFANVQKSSTTIYSKYTKVTRATNEGAITYLQEVLSSGSGAFFYDTAEDLAQGFLITAAHCVLKTQTINTIDVMLYEKSETIYFTHPITNQWIKANPDDIYLDGVADIAVIRTGIDLTNHTTGAIEMSKEQPMVGDICYVCGNPLGLDDDSLTTGIVRDPHYTLRDGMYVPDALHINAPGSSGNSGSAILNKHGKMIGLLVFGIRSTETYNGGPNLDTLQQSLKVLKSLKNHTEKNYLGFRWYIPNPITLQNYYSNTNTGVDNKGVVIQAIDTEIATQFTQELTTNDLLLSVTMNGKTIELGGLPHQRTPGILLYSSGVNSITIRYRKQGDTAEDRTAEIILESSSSLSSSSSSSPQYPETKDLPLIGG
jgi:S1-C subfamily serine protease